MDAQEQHDLQMQKIEITPGSRERVEDLLATTDQDAPRPTTQDPLAALAERTGATVEDLADHAAELGFA